MSSSRRGGRAAEGRRGRGGRLGRWGRARGQRRGATPAAAADAGPRWQGRRGRASRPRRWRAGLRRRRGHSRTSSSTSISDGRHGREGGRGGGVRPTPTPAPCTPARRRPPKAQHRLPPRLQLQAGRPAQVRKPDGRPQVGQGFAPRGQRAGAHRVGGQAQLGRRARHQGGQGHHGRDAGHAQAAALCVDGVGGHRRCRRRRERRAARGGTSQWSFFQSIAAKKKKRAPTYKKSSAMGGPPAPPRDALLSLSADAVSDGRPPWRTCTACVRQGWAGPRARAHAPPPQLSTPLFFQNLPPPHHIFFPLSLSRSS